MGDCKALFTQILSWFGSDNIELFDSVLSDSETDPHFSAVMCEKRINAYLEANRCLSNNNKTMLLEEYLSICYTQSDISLFKKKLADELKYMETHRLLDHS